MQIFKVLLFFGAILYSFAANAQEVEAQNEQYKKRVLESTEVDILTSYYGQNGNNAAVTGGIGTENLTDFTATYIISIPLNEDDILTIDAGISAYTSASSSNVDPFDGGIADAFQASSGASSGDVWVNLTGVYSHSSDDRNTIWSGQASISREYDYFSLGIGASFTKLYNQKNTEFSVSANAYFDNWSTIYPFELRPFSTNGDGIENQLFSNKQIIGNTNYNPILNQFSNTSRNSYSLGLRLSQILSKNLQASFSLDLITQQGLLSTPFQRVHFSDIEDSFIESFQLADANEILPDNRIKAALGGRLNWYLNEAVTLRTYYRYYRDNWGIESHTANVELPIKIGSQFTVYPSYRFYNQTEADYFKPHEVAKSTDEFYTSDYDLSNFSANQIGIGISYTDIFTKVRIGKWAIKTIDLKIYQYDRNTTFSSGIITLGVKLIKS